MRLRGCVMPAHNNASTGGDVTFSLIVSNASTCSFFELSQSGSAPFRVRQLNGHAIAAKLVINMRYSLQAPRNEQSSLNERGNWKLRKASLDVSLTASIPGKITRPKYSTRDWKKKYVQNFSVIPASHSGDSTVSRCLMRSSTFVEKTIKSPL